MAITKSEIKKLKQIAQGLRKDVIDITFWSGGAHIGGGLSVLDILVIIYHRFAKVNPKNPQMPDRDRIVLSKGHAGVAYAPLLARMGYFDFELLKDFNKFGSPFGMHLDGNKVKGVDVSTGSLGHGLPISVGLALGARVKKEPWKTYCIVGDGECNEGSVWEAAMAAAHYRLNNLVTFVDRNRLMIDGPTEEVMGVEPLAEKWQAFGFVVKQVNGHDFEELDEAISFALDYKKGPVAIIANTVKGKGVDFMENQVKWHYGGLDSTLWEKARQSVDRSYGDL